MKTIKKQSIMLFSLLINLVVIFTSCKSDETNNPPQQTDLSDHWGSSVSRNFIGKVVDESNSPIDNVTIKIGNEITTTDANGIFVINDVNVFEKFAYITAEKNGYLKGSRALVPTEGTSQVAIILLDENVSGSILSGSDGDVSLLDGTKVSFDGAFKDENGNAYTGNVSVYMHHLSPSDIDIDRTMPGMLYAQNANNEERVLETYGMVNVELRGSGGEKLNLADGHTATIEIPIDASQTNAPNTIELWHFDEEKGYWIEDGTATRIGNKYVGEVSHFSWWNCDAQFPTVNLCARFIDSNNTPLSMVHVELWRASSLVPRIAFSDSNGMICGKIPKNETLTLKVLDICGNLISTNTIGPFNVDSTLPDTIVNSTSQTVNVSGNIIDCNNNLVTDGYVIFRYGSIEIMTMVNNGQYNFTSINCSGNNAFTMEAVDNSSFQSSGQINQTFTMPNTVVGDIVACGSTPQFISFTVDNNPPVIIKSNINAGPFNGKAIQIDGASNGKDIFIAGDVTTLGTYTTTTLTPMAIADMYDGGTGFSPGGSRNLTFVLSSYGVIGQYIDMTFYGSFTDSTGASRNITGIAHVIRNR